MEIIIYITVNVVFTINDINIIIIVDVIITVVVTFAAVVLSSSLSPASLLWLLPWLLFVVKEGGHRLHRFLGPRHHDPLSDKKSAASSNKKYYARCSYLTEA